MRRESLEFISEAILVERLVKEFRPIEKNAGLFDSLGLNTITSEVEDYVKKNMGGEHPYQWVLKLFATGMIFKIHPILGIVAAIADQFGFGVTALISKIGQMLEPKLKAGEPIDLTEANQSVMSIIQSQAGPLEGTTSKESSSFYGIMKFAWGAGGITALLSKLSPKMGKWGISGIVWFVIKALLLGAGLVAGAGFIKSLFDKDKKPGETSTPASNESSSQSGSSPQTAHTPTGSSILKPSGRGQQNFANDSANIWIVPLIDGSIEETLVAWAVDVYPELRGKETQIESLPSFDYAANMLHQNFDRSNPDHLVVPQGYHTRKEIVDLFSKEAEKLIGK